jgi:EthD domain
VEQASRARVSALVEAPTDVEPGALRDAWCADDPFLRLDEVGVLRYVRALAVPNVVPGFKSPRRLGVASFWLADDAAANVLADRLNRGEFANGTALASAQISAVPVRAYVVAGTFTELSDDLKAVYFVKRREGMSVADYQQHWRYVHGPLVVGHDGMTCYSQGHRLLSSYGVVDSIYDGVTEIIHADEAAAVTFGEAQPHVAVQVADVPNVFDTTVGKRVLTREQLMFEH